MENRYQAKITNYQILEGDVVVYYVLVQDSASESVKTSRFRYSELKAFHEKIKKMLSEYHIQGVELPHFPGKKLFGTTNKNEEAILDRKNDIEQYINEILVIKKLWSLEIVKSIVGTADEEELNILDIYLADPLKEKDWDPPQNQGKVGNLFRVSIESFCRDEDTIKYYFKFYDMKQKQTWETKFRYSELKGFNEAIQKESKTYKTTVPKFPGKKIFGITNEDKQEIFNRRDQLQDYLNSIFSNPLLCQLPVVQYFIEDSKLHSEENEIELRQLQFKFLMKKLKMRKEQTLKFISQSNKRGFKALKEYVLEYIQSQNSNHTSFSSQNQRNSTTSDNGSHAGSMRGTLQSIQEDGVEEQNINLKYQKNKIYINQMPTTRKTEEKSISSIQEIASQDSKNSSYLAKNIIPYTEFNQDQDNHINNKTYQGQEAIQSEEFKDNSRQQQ